MKIHRDVLKGVLPFRGKHPNLRGCRVSDDGKWLVAGNGYCLAFGSIAATEEFSHGATFDGGALDTLSRAVGRNATVIDLQELLEAPLLCWDIKDGSPLQVARAQHQLPAPESVIPDMVMKRDDEAPAIAVASKYLTLAARVMVPFTWSFLYSAPARGTNVRGLWVCGKAGTHELRVFIMPSYVPAGSWPS